LLRLLLLLLRLLLLRLLLLCLLVLLLSGDYFCCLLERLLSGGLFILSGGLLLLLSDGLLLLGLRLSGGLLLLDFLPRSLGLYSGLSLGLLLREALLPVLLCEVLLLLRLLCLSLSWSVAGDKVRLLGIWGIRKGFRPRMLLIRIVKKSFIKKLRSVSKNWKVYLRFGN